MSLGVGSLRFIFLGSVSAFWVWMAASFRRLGKFSVIIYFSKLSTYSLCSPSGTSVMPISICLMVSHKSLKLSSLIFVLFSFHSSGWMSSSVQSLGLLTLSSTWSSLPLNPSMEFFSLVMVFFSSVILFGIFKYFLSLFKIFILFIHCSPDLCEHLYNHYFEFSI